jgi:hypothetical protein
MGKKKGNGNKMYMESFSPARLRRCSAVHARHTREQERKGGSEYESSSNICLCGHRSFHGEYRHGSLTVLSTRTVRVRQDKTGQSTESSPVLNLSSPWAQEHHPAFAPRAPSVPHALQTQNPAAPQKRARSCSQDRTRPSLAPVSKADRSESAMRQNRLLHRTSPVAVDDREHSYAEPVYYPSREVVCQRGGGRT